MAEKTPLLSSWDQPKDVLQGIQERVSQLNNEVVQLSRMASDIGTQKDTEHFRDQLRQKRESCANLARTTMQQLKQPQTRTLGKMKYDKLMKQFNDIFASCQQISKDTIQKERMLPVRSETKTTKTSQSPMQQRQQQNSQPRQAYEPEPEETQEAWRLKAQIQTQQYDVGKSIIEERNTEIKFLESEMSSLNELFVDIASMIQDQGEDIGTIESHVNASVASVEQGNVELTKASHYQKSARKKMCCILLLVAIILAIVVIIVLFVIKPFK